MVRPLIYDRAWMGQINTGHVQFVGLSFAVKLPKWGVSVGLII